MPEIQDAPIHVTETLYGVDGIFDLPLIVIALVLTIIALFRTSNWWLSLLSLALACFAIKHTVYYLAIQPSGTYLIVQTWLGTAGWLLIAIFACRFVFSRGREKGDIQLFD